MIQQIFGVSKSKDGKKTFAVNAKGEPMFANGDLINQLAANKWCNVTEQLQTMTYNDKGELVELPVEQQRKLLIISAVFETEDSAIRAIAGERLFNARVDAYVAAETKKISKEFNLEEALAGA